MKKILFLAFLFIGCNSNNDTVTISKIEYRKLTGDSTEPVYPKPFERYNCYECGGNFNINFHIILASDGHEYIENDRGHGYVFIHSPECIKCKKDSL